MVTPSPLGDAAWVLVFIALALGMALAYRRFAGKARDAGAATAAFARIGPYFLAVRDCRLLDEAGASRLEVEWLVRNENITRALPLEPAGIWLWIGEDLFAPRPAPAPAPPLAPRETRPVALGYDLVDPAGAALAGGAADVRVTIGPAEQEGARGPFLPIQLPIQPPVDRPLDGGA